MSKNGKTVAKGYVKTENMLLVALLSIAVGFLLGVVFTVYRSGSSVDSMGGISNQQAQTEAMLIEQHQDEIAALEDETIKNPANAEAWVSLANLYFDTNQIKKAISAYETALKLNGEQANVWTDLGVMYRRDNRPEDAVEAFDKAIALNPKHEISRFNKGIVLLHDLKDNKGAMEAWNSLLRINPDALAPGGQRVDALVEQFSAMAAP